MYGIAGLLAGRTLGGRYLIEAVVGRGGMGAVYRGVDERLSRPVAVKVIGTSTTDPAEHDRLRARFHREARAAAALHHANVVQVHDFGTDPELDLDFLVMELLRGEDLAARLVRTGAPPLPTAVAILRQSARGLSAGHRAGMVHRDVKPGNLFLEVDDERGDVRVKVLDFGIAQLEADDGTVTHLTQYGRSPFSPAYASPEQLRGDDGITPASDVFSLSAVGYHLVTGRRAFTSADPGRVQEELAESMRALRERAPALDDLTHEVLVRGLSWRPLDRFRDAAEVAEALGGVMPARAGSTAPRPAPVPSRDEATRLWSAPTRGTPTPLARPVHAGVGGGGDETQLAPDPVRPRAVAHASAATSVPFPRQAPPLPVGAHDQPAPMIPPARRPATMRGFFRALWDFTVTAVALTLFVGAWAVAIYGVAEDRDRLLYAGGAATLLMTPLAVHRLTGRRGRYSFGVVGSVLATLCAVRVVGLEADPAIGLAAVFGLQILACFLMSWLTKRKPREEEVALQTGA